MDVTFIDQASQTPASNEPPIDRAPTSPRFAERHRRTVAAPVGDVWPHCLAVTPGEIRVLGPLLALRGVPAKIVRRRSPAPARPEPLLETFVDEGFIELHRDRDPVDGRASVILGAAGRFWSPTGNAPIRFDRASDFLGFDTPGHAKTVVRLEATDAGDGRTCISTETLVDGTDPASVRKFAAYWAIIRLPSGLIRRSWLAAIERRMNP